MAIVELSSCVWRRLWDICHVVALCLSSSQIHGTM